MTESGDVDPFGARFPQRRLEPLGQVAHGQRGPVADRVECGKVTDKMSTADNFPALDLVDGNVRMRSRTTGNALDDLNAFDNALDAGERIDINIDGGTVYQVKSRAVSASEVVRQTTRDISNLAS